MNAAFWQFVCGCAAGKRRQKKALRRAGGLDEFSLKRI
jgi:hypothetical protein